VDLADRARAELGVDRPATRPAQEVIKRYVPLCVPGAVKAPVGRGTQSPGEYGSRRCEHSQEAAATVSYRRAVPRWPPLRLRCGNLLSGADRSRDGLSGGHG
jgi:hypothetical protein